MQIELEHAVEEVTEFRVVRRLMIGGQSLGGYVVARHDTREAAEECLEEALKEVNEGDGDAKAAAIRPVFYLELTPYRPERDRIPGDIVFTTKE